MFSVQTFEEPLFSMYFKNGKKKSIYLKVRKQIELSTVFLIKNEYGKFVSFIKLIANL